MEVEWVFLRLYYRGWDDYKGIKSIVVHVHTHRQSVSHECIFEAELAPFQLGKLIESGFQHVGKLPFLLDLEDKERGVRIKREFSHWDLANFLGGHIFPCKKDELMSEAQPA